MKLTNTVPIVGIDLESDPVARGFVKSLARPGGNVTGIWMDLPEIAGKQLQFLKEAVPTLPAGSCTRHDSRRVGDRP